MYNLHTKTRQKHAYTRGRIYKTFSEGLQTPIFPKALRQPDVGDWR